MNFEILKMILCGSATLCLLLAGVLGFCDNDAWYSREREFVVPKWLLQVGCVVTAIILVIASVIF